MNIREEKLYFDKKVACCYLNKFNHELNLNFLNYPVLVYPELELEYERIFGGKSEIFVNFFDYKKVMSKDFPNNILKDGEFRFISVKSLRLVSKINKNDFIGRCQRQFYCNTTYLKNGIRLDSRRRGTLKVCRTEDTKFFKKGEEEVIKKNESAEFTNPIIFIFDENPQNVDFLKEIIGSFEVEFHFY